MDRKKSKQGRHPKKQQTSVLAKKLERILKERNISTRVAADMAGVGQSTIQSWLCGSAPADLQAVAKLARGLGVSFSYLCLGEHESVNVSELPLSSIFQEEEFFEGIIKLKAIRLTRKIGGNSEQ